MSEFTPQFTYSAEDDRLRFVTDLDTQPAIAQKQLEEAENLAVIPGIETSESQGVVTADIEVVRALGRNFNNSGDDRLEYFMRSMDRLLFSDRNDIDKVVGLRWWNARSAKALIFPQFQKWLNTKPLNDTLAAETFDAMALPFGKKTSKETNAKLNGEEDWYSLWAYGMTIHPAIFRVHKQEEKEEVYEVTDGKVQWSWLDIKTLGDCACWGATGEARERVNLRPDRKELYEMSPHNWDYARQSLSMVLGLGTLARHAAEYKGTEDIWAGVEWQETATIPKSI